MKATNILKRTTAAVMVAVALAACAAPEFRQPEMAVPAAFKEASATVVVPDGPPWKQAQAAEAQPRGQWWLAFGDPALTVLIDEATAGNTDLARAKTELAQARAEAIGLEQQRTTAEHALAVLLGKPASAFTAAAHPLDTIATLPAIPAGLPSSLLERRPDIVTAQRTMEASNARIGVARAAMFPALSLTASGGGTGGALADVFRWSSRSWLLGALMSMPVIDGGRNKSNVARSEAVLEESVGNYRQHVLVAFAEIEDSLAGLRILAGQAQQTEEAVVSARRAAQLAQLLYHAGRTSYLDLLEAQRNLTTVERTAVQLRGARAVTTVALVRALGGGWDTVPAGEGAQVQALALAGK